MKQDSKTLLSNAIVDLCREGKSLEKLTVSDIIKRAQVGRQTFYNNFGCKDDLIRFAYLSNTLYCLKSVDNYSDYHDYLVDVYTQFLDYSDFFIQARKMTDYSIINHAIQTHLVSFFQEYIRSRYGAGELTPTVMFAIKFNSYGVVNTLTEWYMDKNRSSPMERAKNVLSCMPIPLRKYFPIRPN